MSRNLFAWVKSRYQTDSDRAFPLKEKTFGAFDYVIAVFLNIGFFIRKKPSLEGRTLPQFYTLPTAFIQAHHRKSLSGWEKVLTKNVDMTQYEGDAGFEQIAKDLDISYPSRGNERIIPEEDLP